MEDFMSAKGNFITGLAIGLVAGSVVALLSAPQSGEETRQLINDKTGQIKDRASDTIDEVLSQAENGVMQARQLTSTTIKNARERVDKLQSQGNKLLEEQKKRLDRLSKSAASE